MRLKCTAWICIIYVIANVWALPVKDDSTTQKDIGSNNSTPISPTAEIKSIINVSASQVNVSNVADKAQVDASVVADKVIDSLSSAPLGDNYSLPQNSTKEPLNVTHEAEGNSEQKDDLVPVSETTKPEVERKVTVQAQNNSAQQVPVDSQEISPTKLESTNNNTTVINEEITTSQNSQSTIVNPPEADKNDSPQNSQSAIVVPSEADKNDSPQNSQSAIVIPSEADKNESQQSQNPQEINQTNVSESKTTPGINSVSTATPPKAVIQQELKENNDTAPKNVEQAPDPNVVEQAGKEEEGEKGKEEDIDAQKEKEVGVENANEEEKEVETSEQSYDGKEEEKSNPEGEKEQLNNEDDDISVNPEQSSNDEDDIIIDVDNESSSFVPSVGVNENDQQRSYVSGDDDYSYLPKTPDKPKIEGQFTDDSDSHFFAYFLTVMVTAIIFYLVFHNKQRIIALIIEGRVPRSDRTRRSSNRVKYHKLDNNLEEAMTATKGANGREAYQELK